MPGTSGRNIGKFEALGFPFLDAVFAEMTKAGGVGFADGACWVGFGYGDKGDFFGVAFCFFGGLRDAGLDTEQVLGDGRRHGLVLDES